MASKAFPKIDFKLVTGVPNAVSTKSLKNKKGAVGATILQFAHQVPKKNEKALAKVSRKVLDASKRVLAGVKTAQPGFNDFSGQSGQAHVAYAQGQRTITIGLGPLTTANSSPKTLRDACGTAVKVLKSLKVDKASVVLPPLVSQSVKTSLTESYHLGKATTMAPVNNNSSSKLASHVAQWFEERNYKQMNYFGGEAQKKEHFIRKIDLVMDANRNQFALTAAKQQEVRNGASLGRATNVAKFLGNTRPDTGNPEFYSKWADALVKKHKGVIQLRHKLVGTQLEKQGLNLFWNVGMGSVFKPHLVVLEYVGAPKDKNSTAIVGKGVTFDTGGLHVKPYGSMEQMHMDMCGAAAVLGTMQTIAEQKLKVNVTAVLGLAENAIGSRAYRPSSILKSLKGSTVEILNTDAEGRLVLADSLTFVQDKAKLTKKPTEIIDLATLTGAVLIALGSDRAAVFSNSDRLRSDLYNSGVESQEPLWPLPVAPEHVKKMVGSMSDLKNIGGGREAGSATAAAFLQHFINKGTPWAHLDIAGTAMNTGLNGTQKGGASGYGVSLLTHYLSSKQHHTKEKK